MKTWQLAHWWMEMMDNQVARIYADNYADALYCKDLLDDGFSQDIAENKANAEIVWFI